MSTTAQSRHRSPRRAILVLAAGSLAALVLTGVGQASTASSSPSDDDDDAPGSALPVTGLPAPDAIAATFTRRSYRAGETADLRIAAAEANITLRIFRAGHGHEGVMRGA